MKTARDGLEKGAQLWQRAGFPWVTAIQGFLGGTALVQGDWSDARRLLDEAVTSPLVGSMGGVEESFLLLLLSYSGDDKASTLLDRLASRLPPPGVTNGLGAWGLLLASVEAAVLLERRKKAAALYPLVRQLMADRTVILWTHGLVEKAAAIAAAARPRLGGCGIALREGSENRRCDAPSHRAARGAPLVRADVARSQPSRRSRCPKCGGPMAVIERLTAVQIQLRSPPLLVTTAA